MSEMFSGIFSDVLIKQLLTLLGLILLQVILAVALAIRDKVFDWRKLADFYRSLVVPFIVGWLAFVFVARLISADLLGDQYSVIIGDGVTWLAWLALVASLAGRIIDTAKLLYGSLMPFPDPLVKGERYDGDKG